MTTSAAVGYYWGDDGFGIDRAADALGARVAEEAGSPLERWRVTGEGTTAAVIGERVATAPLFGGGTLVVVAGPLALIKAKERREELAVVITAIAPGNALAFIDPIDEYSPRKSLDAARAALRTAVLEAGGDARDFVSPKAGAMARWIEERAAERGIRLGRGAAQELATRVGAFVTEGDVDRRRQGQLAVGELDKLALYRPEMAVEVDDVRALVSEAVPGSTWAFLDALGERRIHKASEILERLLEEAPPPLLLFGIHRRVRQLLEVADRLAAGEGEGSLVRSMGLKPYVADKLVGQARAWSADELEAALEGLLELDALVKGADGTIATGAQVRFGFTLWFADHVARTSTTGARDTTGGSRPGRVASTVTARR
jgi:DNA polymerase III subunit delta